MTQRSQNLTTVKYKNKLTCSQSEKATAKPVAVLWGAEAPPPAGEDGAAPQARLCRAGPCPAPKHRASGGDLHPPSTPKSLRALHGNAPSPPEMAGTLRTQLLLPLVPSGHSSQGHQRRANRIPRSAAPGLCPGGRRSLGPGTDASWGSAAETPTPCRRLISGPHTPRFRGGMVRETGTLGRGFPGQVCEPQDRRPLHGLSERVREQHLPSGRSPRLKMGRQGAPAGLVPGAQVHAAPRGISRLSQGQVPTPGGPA